MTQTLNKVTFGHLLTVLAVILIPLLVWGVSIENRFEQVIDNTADIQEIKQTDKELETQMDKNHSEVMKVLLEIKVEQAKAHN